MKKLIFLMIGLLLIGSLFVNAKINEPTWKQKNVVATQTQQEIATQQKSEVKGLENAVLKVKTQERVQHLNQVMNKIQEHKRVMLNNMENLEIEEDEEGIKATGQKEAMFLNAFKFKRTFQYRIDEEGEVKRVKAWHDFLWKLED